MVSPLCDENQESRMTDYYFYKYELVSFTCGLCNFFLIRLFSGWFFILFG